SLTTGTQSTGNSHGALIALDHTSSSDTATGGKWNFAILARRDYLPDKAASSFAREWKLLSYAMFNVHAIIELMTDAKSYPVLEKTYLNFCSLPSTNVWTVKRLPKSQGMDHDYHTPHSNDWARVSNKLFNALIEVRSRNPEAIKYRSSMDASKEELSLLPAKKIRAKDWQWKEIAEDSLFPGQIVYAEISSLIPHSRCGVSSSSPMPGTFRALIALNYVSMDKGGRWYFASLIDARNPRYRDLDDRAWVPLSKAMSDIGESDTFEKEDKSSFPLLDDALLALAPNCFLENGELVTRLLKRGYTKESSFKGNPVPATQMDQSNVIGKAPDPHSEAWLRVSKELVNALIQTRPRIPFPGRHPPDERRYSGTPTSLSISPVSPNLPNLPDPGMDNLTPLTLSSSSVQGLQLAPVPKNLPAATPGRPSPPTRRYSGTLKPSQKTDNIQYSPMISSLNF
ncbi:hypothetical protein H0H93_009134, partial [Arthromyces matolae]